MKRRALFAVTAALTVTARSGAGARSDLPTIGYLSASSAELSAPLLASFRDGLKESGFVEGRNVVIEARWADGNYARLPSMAAELVALRVTLIVAIGGPAAQAAKEAAPHLPIVFQTGVDPVKTGLVASLPRPGGNATGISLSLVELSAKRLELLRELLPRTRTVAVLFNPDAPSASIQLDGIRDAAGGMGLTLQVLGARTVDETEHAFARLADRRPDALLVASDVLFSAQREQIVKLSARLAIPAIFELASFVAAGGLISYGPDLGLAVRPLGIYAGKILGGAKPGDLPVQRPTHFELAINLKTAKALGIPVPGSILARADQVIE